MDHLPFRADRRAFLTILSSPFLLTSGNLILLLVFVDDLLLVGIVPRNALDFGEWRHFQFVLGVALVEHLLLLQYLLHGLTHVLVQFLHESLLLMVLLDPVLNEGKGPVYDILVEFQLIFLLLKIFLRRIYFDWVEVEHFVLSLVPKELRIELAPLETDLVLFLPSLVNLAVVVGFHVLCLLLHLGDLGLQVLKSHLGGLLLFDYFALHLLLFPLLVDDLLLQPVEFLLQLFVLYVSIFNDLNFLLQLLVLSRVFLDLYEFDVSL